MKLFFKIIGFFLYFFYFTYCFSFDATIKVDNENIDINDYINLKIEINSSSINSDIDIEKIDGIENFEIIRQSQSQSSSMSSVNINGKIESKNNYKYVLNITLKAKSKGKYIIGPAHIKFNNENITTNSININVSGKKIYINNNGPLILPDYNQKEKLNNNSEKINKSNKKFTNDEDENNIENSSYNFGKINSKNDYEILILVIVLITFTLFTYELLKKNFKN